MTAEERQRIKDEEYYRHEVRKSLGEDKEPRLWKFLNSHFGIFLLSTVMVSGLTAAYTKWQDGRKQRQAKAEKIRKLDNEISNRLAQSIRYLDLQRVRVVRGYYPPGSYPPAHSAYGVASYYVDNDFPTEAGSTKRYNYSLYPEMSGLSYRTLLTELASELPQDAVDSIEVSLLAYEDLLDQGSYFDAGRMTDSAAYMTGVMGARQLLLKRMHLSRWHFLTPLRRELLR